MDLVYDHTGMAFDSNFISAYMFIVKVYGVVLDLTETNAGLVWA